jgi:2-octaprenylphenol hydroxylase
MTVWDELGTAQINFDAAEIYQDALGCIVENQTIVSALQAVLREQENLQCFYGQKIKSINALAAESGQHALMLESGQQVRCQLLVAADGAMSRIRQWAGMPTREWDYQHEAIVATVETEKPHAFTAWQRFSESGPLAFLPLADANSSGHFCSIVWSQDTARAHRLMALDDAAFLAELEAAIEARLGKLVAISPRHAFPLRQRHAKTYVKPGLVLVGDAAHTIHPLAGQGVNLGFKDVSVLADILKQAERQSLDVNNMLLLKRYQRQRQGDNLLMMAAMEGFKRLFAQPDPVVRWLRNSGMDWVNRQGFLKNQLARHAMGLSL